MILERNATEHLTGLTLEGGWTVTQKLAPMPGATGSTFSVGYIVRNVDGASAFLKAFDFTRTVLRADDRLREMQRALAAYNYERDVLSKCSDRRLSHVATAVAEGSIKVPDCGLLDEVHYLIFDLASGDVRAELSAPVSVVWKLRALHEVAVGLTQLHGVGIAHQDIKASNVLTFPTSHRRLGDLGRACDRASPAPHDDDHVAGDPAYAPPELLYRETPADWHSRRMGCDAYLLGSLVYFFFTTASLTEAMLSKTYSGYHHVVWDGTFSTVLPFLISAFDDVITDFKGILLASGLPVPLATKLVQIVRQLAFPDPSHRGHPSIGGVLAGRFRLDRYVTELDLLARRAALVKI